MTSFDTQVQCEEFFIEGEGLRAQIPLWAYLLEEDAEQSLRNSEDVMDRCEVVGLDRIHNRTYQMDDIVNEDLDNDWLWDAFHLTQQERIDRMTIGKMRLN